MCEVFVIGAGIGARWGRYDGSLVEMLAESALSAMDDAKVDSEIEYVFVANMGAGAINNQSAVGSALIDYINLLPAGACSIENGPASGATAARLAYSAVASGLNDVVMVVGGEKMRVASGPKITDFVATMAHPTAEYRHGVTLPSLGGMLARLYFERFGVTREDLSTISIKNHANGALNPYAHLQQKISLEGILTSREAKINNPVIADPLHLYDVCPVTDGAAAIILATREVAEKLGKPLIKYAGTGQATDTMAVHERTDPTFLKSVKIASDQAFKMANLTRKDIDFAEIHDAFEILELAELEAAGFYEHGKAHLAIRKGETELKGKFPVNPSGGLKARGHPVGATGVAQLVELVWQLRGEGGERQVPNNPKNGYAVNFGGFGNNVVATILTKI